MKLFLRLFASCSGPEEAAAIDARLRQALSEWHPSPTSLARPYWKNEAQFEFTFNLLPASAASFISITSLTKEGWSDHQVNEPECSAVWNSVPGSSFLAPEVAWANLELIAS
jgi:hypothetical protein